VRRYRRRSCAAGVLIYNDGIQTISDGDDLRHQIGLDDNAMIGALLVTSYRGSRSPSCSACWRQDRREDASSAGARGLPVITGDGLLSTVEFFTRRDGRHGAGRHAGASRSLFAS
jgi:hypothetical protein